MTTTTIEMTLECLECSNCGMLYGLTEDFIKRRRDDKERFYCPRGDWQSYGGKTDAQKLKEAKADAERVRNDAALAWRRFNEERADHVDTKATLRTTKGHVTRMRNRIAAGTCPWCERQFPDLEQHVGAEHPDQLAAAEGDTATPAVVES